MQEQLMLVALHHGVYNVGSPSGRAAAASTAPCRKSGRSPSL